MVDIVLTGIGIVSPLGIGSDAVRSALQNGDNGVGDLTLFESPGHYERAAEVGEYDWKEYLFTKQTFADRCTELILGAARMALEDAGLGLPLTAAQAPVGFCFGTQWGCMDAMERFYEPVAGGNGKRASSLVFSHSYPNCPTSFVAIELGLRGYSTSFTGSDQAGLWALRDACDAMRLGTADRVLVGAADALSLARMAHDEAEGAKTVPGEGAIALMLETTDAADQRGTEVLARVMTGDGSTPVSAFSGWNGGAITPLLALLSAFWTGDSGSISLDDESFSLAPVA